MGKEILPKELLSDPHRSQVKLSKAHEYYKIKIIKKFDLLNNVSQFGQIFCKISHKMNKVIER